MQQEALYSVKAPNSCCALTIGTMLRRRTRRSSPWLRLKPALPCAPPQALPPFPASWRLPQPPLTGLRARWWPATTTTPGKFVFWMPASVVLVAGFLRPSSQKCSLPGHVRIMRTLSLTSTSCLLHALRRSLNQLRREIKEAERKKASKQVRCCRVPLQCIPSIQPCDPNSHAKMCANLFPDLLFCITLTSTLRPLSLLVWSLMMTPRWR